MPETGSVPVVVGLDVGSSGCKALALNGSGEVLATAAQPFSTLHPRPGWATQDPEEWYAAARMSIRACAGHPNLAGCKVVGLSVTGPAHSVALLDQDERVIAPTIHTSDLRSTAQAQRIEREFGERVVEISYQRANPSWTLAHLLWLKENEPDLFARLRKIRVVKDYVRSRLTGDNLTDDYDAIGTQMFDVRAKEWSTELFELVGLTRHHAPCVAGAFSIAGTVRNAEAREFGLPFGTPVAVGSGDSVVEALGAGVVRPGQATIKLGTHANVNVVAPAIAPSRSLIAYRHLVDELGFNIAATSSGAASLRWFREAFMHHGATANGAELEAKQNEVEALASRVARGCEGLLFHPYLMGERTPHWDPMLRGSFIGIGAHHKLEHFLRAVLEGVAFSLLDCARAHESAPGSPRISELWLLGGGSNIDEWRRIVCDVVGRPLMRPVAEGAAFGAAMVAGVAVGLFGDWREAVRACVKVRDAMEPDPVAHAHYSELFGVYVAVSQDLARHSHRLVELAK